MRRVFILWVLMLLTMQFQPATAQDGSVLDVIQNRRDLSTFATFVEVARPSVIRQYERGGAYTVFAPNNVAFANLASTLNISLAELLQNADIVTQLVQYHIIAGERFEGGIRQLNGQIIPTTLRGAFINIRVNDNNIISVNNVVEVIETNINASNGVVHVINDVLLNRIIADSIEGAPSLITPNPPSQTDTPAPTATLSATATPVPRPTLTIDGEPVVNLRVAHLSPDTAGIDLYVNQELALEAAEYGDVSPFLSYPPGTYTLAVVQTGDSLNDTVLGPFELTLDNQSFVTLAAIGSAEAGTLTLDAVSEDFSAVAAETSRVVFYHALAGAPNLDILLNGDVAVMNLAYGDSAVLDLETGEYDPIVLAADTADDVIIDPDPVQFSAGSYYLMITGGRDGEPETLSAEISTRVADNLRSGTDLDVSEAFIRNGDEGDDMIDVIDSSDNFTILLAAIETADEDVINRLGAQLQEPVTLLAPTDAAFEDLIATLEITQAELLSNTEILTDILLYHQIEGAVRLSDFRAAAGTSVITRLPENQAFFVTVSDQGDIILNSFVRFEQTNITANNGLIHVVDNVLLPQSALDAFGL
jgi:uncharacterized surface protein with fasciclin (FAS1) repeats